MSLAASTLLLSVASTANAEESSPDFAVDFRSTVTFDEAMKQNRISASATNEAIDAHVTDMKERGLKVDPADVNAVEFTEPSTGEQVTATWEEGITPTRFDTALGTYSEGAVQMAYGVGVDLAAGSTSGPSAKSQFDVETEGMTQEGDGCVRVEFEPTYASGNERSNHALVSCYEKYKAEEIESPDHRDWGYFRYGNFTTASPVFDVLEEPKIVDFSLRTQPWDGNSDGTVNRMTGFSPQGPSQECRPGTSLSLSVGPASLSYPAELCDLDRVAIDPAKARFGVIYKADDRNAGKEVQIANNYAMALEANGAGTEVVMSDYAWAEVQWRDPNGATDSQASLWTDGGWEPWPL